MSKTYAIALIGVIAIAVCLLGLYISGIPSGPPSFLSFSRNRSQAYYSGYADACNRLIAEVAMRRTNETRLNGDDIRLPKLLQDMHSTYLTVSTNRVWLVVDIAAGYGVVWGQDDINSNLWKLTIRSEAEPIYVLVRTNK